jgi:uncharacterized membrane protein YdjX (TVP38/TMEM64 family)
LRPETAKLLPRLLLLGLMAAGVIAFFRLGLQDAITLEALKARQEELQALVVANPLLAPALFFLLYIAVTGLSLPGAAILTLAAGALFGLLQGTVIVSFASTIGATLAFLVSRFLLRGAVVRRFGARLHMLETGFARDGPFYLLTLRLVPVVPFFLVNLLMGLTAIRTFTFAWVSQLGMLPGTLVYVNAGRELAGIETLSDILSPRLLGAFLLLALFPWVARFLIGRLRALRTP